MRLHRFAVSVLLSALLLMVFLPSAGCKKRYVGQPVNPGHPSLCHCRDLPAECVIQDTYFLFAASVRQGETPEEKVVEGTAQYMGQGGFGTIMSAGPYGGSTFSILLVKDGVVVDNQLLNMTGDDLDNPLSFKKTVTGIDFDSLLFWYAVAIRD